MKEESKELTLSIKSIKLRYVMLRIIKFDSAMTLSTQNIILKLGKVTKYHFG